MAGKAPWRKISSLAVSEASLARSLAIVRPAMEKTCSEGADVAGMQRTLEASTDRSLYFLSLNFHQVIGQLKVPSSFLSQIDGSCLYKVNSASAAVAAQTSGSLAEALSCSCWFGWLCWPWLKCREWRGRVYARWYVCWLLTDWGSVLCTYVVLSLIVQCTCIVRSTSVTPPGLPVRSLLGSERTGRPGPALNSSRVATLVTSRSTFRTSNIQYTERVACGRLQ